MKNVIAKTKSAMGNSSAPAPNASVSAWPTARVTTAVLGATTEMNIATASTATATPTMSFCVDDSTGATGAFALCLAFAGDFDLFELEVWDLEREFFLAAFDLRLEGIYTSITTGMTMGRVCVLLHRKLETVLRAFLRRLSTLEPSERACASM